MEKTSEYEIYDNTMISRNGRTGRMEATVYKFVTNYSHDGAMYSHETFYAIIEGDGDYCFYEKANNGRFSEINSIPKQLLPLILNK